MKVTDKVEAEVLETLFRCLPSEEYVKVSSLVMRYGKLMEEQGRQEEKNNLIEIILGYTE